jgi:hypothetical protein
MLCKFSPKILFFAYFFSGHLSSMCLAFLFLKHEVVSTENVAFKLTDSVLKFITKQVHVSGIFCDLAKVLTVSHKIILTKLHSLAFEEQQGVDSDHT